MLTVVGALNGSSNGVEKLVVVLDDDPEFLYANLRKHDGFTDVH